ncbi:MAG: spore germination protein [Clostridia bacterium]|nr:spore germination protein [Clostridia bacterium]
MEKQVGFAERVRRMDARLRVQENFDLIKKEMVLGHHRAVFYYVDGFIEGSSMGKLMIYLLSLKGLCPPEIPNGRAAATYFAEHHMPHVEVEVSDDEDLMVQMVLSGTSLFLGETFGECALIVDSRTYPSRSVGEPENDRVMLGARDGFVETLVFNTAMVRRRIRDPALTMRHLTVGSESRSDVVISYLKGRADADYVRRLEEKLKGAKTRSLAMGHESLAELLIADRWYNPFPKIRYTERPDVAAAQLLEGSVLILCDNSPEVMILPSTVFDFLQETNDFYFPPLTGTYIRLVRHLVFWATLFLVPVWFLFTKNPALTPSWLTFVLPEALGKIPIFVQLLIVEFMIDGLRMASMNTPNMLSNSLSVVGGLILGEFAVSIGWLIPEVIVYMAFVAIANFSQRSYQLGYAFKFMRILLLILIQCFNVTGFFAGLGVILLLLVTNRTVNGRRSYLYPLIPFNGRALLSLFFRVRKDRFVGTQGEEGKNGE